MCQMLKCKNETMEIDIDNDENTTDANIPIRYDGHVKEQSPLKSMSTGSGDLNGQSNGTECHSNISYIKHI